MGYYNQLKSFFGRHEYRVAPCSEVGTVELESGFIKWLIFIKCNPSSFSYSFYRRLFFQLCTKFCRNWSVRLRRGYESLVASRQFPQHVNHTAPFEPNPADLCGMMLREFAGPRCSSGIESSKANSLSEGKKKVHW